VPEYKISIIIPAYNEEQNITDCLESVAGQAGDYCPEVIVVDSSSDRTPEIIRRRFPQVKLLHFSCRTDQGQARNRGLQEAKGDILFFLDADCIAPSNWINYMLKWHSEGYDMVGGTVINGNPESAISWAGYILEFSNLFPTETAVEAQHLPAGNVSYKRAVLEKHGEFPSGLRYALEDLIYHWDLSRKGVRMLFDPRIQVLHRHRSNFKDYLQHQHKLGRGNLQLLRYTDLQGSWLVRHPFWAIFILPLLPVVKLCRNSFLYIKWKGAEIFRQPQVFLIMAVGLIWWLVGFTKELYAGKRHNNRV